MTALAPHLEAFLRDHLQRQRGASPHTCDSYAGSFGRCWPSRRLACTRPRARSRSRSSTRTSSARSSSSSARPGTTARRPAMCAWQRSAPSSGFCNTASRPRSSRFAASWRFRSITGKPPRPLPHGDRGASPGRRAGARHAIRDSRSRDAPPHDLCRTPRLGAHGPAPGRHRGPGRSIRIRGKGRRERALPLWKFTAAALRAWLAIRGLAPTPKVFVNARGQPFSRWGIAHVLRGHGTRARQTCASLARKRLSPHVLRHTCAMIVLQTTHDIRKVSPWLGHSQLATTEMYVRADPSEKLEAIEAIVPPHLRKGVFRPTDALLAWLKAPR